MDIDECASNPCLNGGECNDGAGAYSCDCPTDWKGFNCEHPPHPCDRAKSKAAPCAHGGKCVETTVRHQRVYECNCTAGYMGQTCSMRKADIYWGPAMPSVYCAKSISVQRAASAAEPITQSACQARCGAQCAGISFSRQSCRTCAAQSANLGGHAGYTYLRKYSRNTAAPYTPPPPPPEEAGGGAGTAVLWILGLALSGAILYAVFGSGEQRLNCPYVGAGESRGKRGGRKQVVFGEELTMAHGDDESYRGGLVTRSDSDSDDESPENGHGRGPAAVSGPAASLGAISIGSASKKPRQPVSTMEQLEGVGKVELEMDLDDAAELDSFLD